MQRVLYEDFLFYGGWHVRSYLWGNVKGVEYKHILVVGTYTAILGLVAFFTTSNFDENQYRKCQMYNLRLNYYWIKIRTINEI